jgi:hypothetical protein
VSVEAAHHASLGCALFGEEEDLRLAKIRELKAWWRARGTYGFIYRPDKIDRGLKSWLWIVAHIPRKSEDGKVSLTSPPMGRLEF